MMTPFVNQGRQIQIQCKECSKVFDAYVSSNRRYCSNRCRQIGVGKILKGRVKNPLHRENPELYNLISRKNAIDRATKWNKEHPERRREIANNYSHKNMSKIVAWNRNHPKERNITIQKGQRKMRQKVIDLLGYHCALCGRDCRGYAGRSSYGLQFHEKNHKKHPSCDWWYILKHMADFIPLCHRCHIIVTQMKTVFNVNFEELKRWLDSRVMLEIREYAQGER